MKMLNSGFLSGMSTNMIGAIIVTFVACIWGTLHLENSRELPNDYERLDRDIQDSQALISDFIAAPVLPSLNDSWREVYASLEMNGLELKPDDGSIENGSASTYDGPLKHWYASVRGDAKTILAVMKKVQKSEPVYLLDYSVADGGFTLYFAVVGI